MTAVPSRLCERLGLRFASDSLLEEALTHRSAGGPNNERLEFLGDGVLNFVIAHELFARFPDASEGDLSRLRAALVKKETLAALAAGLELGDFLRLGSGELKSGGFRRASILADALEAVFGAAYLDGGFGAAREVILRVYARELDNLPDSTALKDPKTRLQELLQARKLPLPEYRVVAVTGEAHAQTFTVACSVAGLSAALEGRGQSRRSAEQEAARQALESLDGK